MRIPILKPKERNREYSTYTETERDMVIYKYLFEGLSHRKLDKTVLKLDDVHSKGWQSMGILHYIGIMKDSKGIFKGMLIDDVIKALVGLKDNSLKEIIGCLKRLQNYNFSYGIYDSWEILNDTVIIKTADKSIFEFSGSGVPKDTIPFWDLGDLKQGEKRIIRIIHKDIEYEAYFRKDIPEPNRMRLLWHANLDDVLRTTFPDYKLYESYKDKYPLMRFERIDIYTYKLSFIILEHVINDVTAEEEDLTPMVLSFKGEKEGQVTYCYSKKYERNTNNRIAAIKIHGTKCACCEFDFEKTYGKRGQGFIEIHHNKPLYSLQKEIVINPITDLIPVCSNCHRIIHRKKDNVLSIEEVRKLVANNN